MLTEKPFENRYGNPLKHLLVSYAEDYLKIEQQLNKVDNSKLKGDKQELKNGLDIISMQIKITNEKLGNDKIKDVGAFCKSLVKLYNKLGVAVLDHSVLIHADIIKDSQPLKIKEQSYDKDAAKKLMDEVFESSTDVGEISEKLLSGMQKLMDDYENNKKE